MSRTVWRPKYGKWSTRHRYMSKQWIPDDQAIFRVDPSVVHQGPFEQTVAAAQPWGSDANEPANRKARLSMYHSTAAAGRALRHSFSLAGQHRLRNTTFTSYDPARDQVRGSFGDFLGRMYPEAPWELPPKDVYVKETPLLDEVGSHALDLYMANLEQERLRQSEYFRREAQQEVPSLQYAAAKALFESQWEPESFAEQVGEHEEAAAQHEEQSDDEYDGHTTDGEAGYAADID